MRAASAAPRPRRRSRVAALLLWPLLFGAPGATGCEGAAAAPATTAGEEVRVVESPHSSLVARVVADTARPCRLSVEVRTGGSVVRRTAPGPRGAHHEAVVAGLRAETAYELVPIFALDEADGGGEERGAAVPWETGPLPPDLPAFEVEVFLPDLVQPGVTLFAPAPRAQHAAGVSTAWFLGVDEAGAVVWYVRDPGVERNDLVIGLQPDGDLLLGVAAGLRVVSVEGETRRLLRWRAVAPSAFHHEAVALAGGRYLTLVGASEQTVSVPWADAPILAYGDEVYELAPDGTPTWTWRAFEHLDPTRFPPGLSRRQTSAGGYEWTHANAVVPLPSATAPEVEALLVSLRNQNQVVKIDRATGAVLWRLGEDGDFALRSAEGAAPARWFWSQHAPEVQPDGSILLFDNRTDAPEPEAARRSRAVLYRLDEADRTATQTWEWEADHLNTFLGDADGLANGSVLVCAGGQDRNDLPARIVEVTRETPARRVWQLETREWMIYRAIRVPSLDPPAPAETEAASW